MPNRFLFCLATQTLIGFPVDITTLMRSASMQPASLSRSPPACGPPHKQMRILHDNQEHRRQVPKGTLSDETHMEIYKFQSFKVERWDIPFNENNKFQGVNVFFFFGFLGSWFLGFLDSLFLGFLVFWFLGFLFSSFLHFKIAKLQSFKTSKIQKFSMFL